MKGIRPRKTPRSASGVRTAMAIGAHPDDIEFYMAGTLALLARAGFEIHYMNLASGSCGSIRHGAARTRALRREEARRAAGILGAVYHSSLVDDLEILYELRILRRLSAVIREVSPAILLTHSPQDYMEDHTNTCRLAVTAAFARGMRNFKTVPSRQPADAPVTVYHAMPHGLRDSLGSPVIPGLFVNTTSTHAVKRGALAAHKTQQEWLDASQGLGSYLGAMDAMSLEVGSMSGRFRHAEGWRRHLHLGFCGEKDDPLREVLKDDCQPNRKSKSETQS